MPVCHACNKKVDQWFESNDGRIFCSNACFKRTWPKCKTCLKPMDKWFSDKSGEKYCSDVCFSDTYPKCNYCGKKMVSWVEYENKKFCSEACAKTT